MKRNRRSSQALSETAALRAGTVLLIVLVVVALLALGAYTFAEIMTVEAQATTTYGREVQARALADSGVELASTLLTKRYLPDSKSYYNDPQMFEGVLLRDATSAKGRGRFSVVTGNEADTSGRTVRFGLSDESSKLNLNTLMRMMGGGSSSSSSSSSSSNSTTTTSAGGTSGSGGGSGGGGGSSGSALKASDVEAMLMVFPDMTSEIAESIIDWMDSDTTPMTSGAENEYYQSLVPAYTAKNGPIDSLDELLLVKGVTPQLLFGEDTNHNGILDPNENDGAATLPLDNADGILQRGWSAYWTVYSRETNLRSDGTPRINVNQSDLSNLFTEVSEAFDAKTATFILQYRVNGPATTGGGQGGNSSNSSGGNNAMASTSGGNSSGGNSSGGNSGAGGNSSSGKSSSTNSSSTSKSSGSSGASSQQSSQTSSGGGQSSGGSSKSSSSGSGGGGTVQRGGSVTANVVGGIDISGGASYTIKSLYELPGARAQQGKGAAAATSSPWPSTPADLTQNLPLIMDKLTLTDDPFIAGRININTAPREVLMTLAGLQGMSETIVDSIYGAQGMRFSGSSGGDVAPDRLYAGWLFTDGLVSSINILETLDPFITGRGDVFHVQSVGYFEGGGPMARVEAIIDATLDPPQVIFLRDLTELGRGFSASLLSTGK